MEDKFNEFEKFKRGDRLVLLAEFSLNDEVNIDALFDKIWVKIKDEPANNIKDMFQGIDIARQSFLACFGSEDKFKQAPEHRKRAFLYATNAALVKVIKDDELLIANGLSLFLLWFVSTLNKDNECAEKIEQSFSDLRWQYNC